MEPCRHICLTPTKNEAWIIRHFLAAAKLWASDIIVADQLSADGTRDILQASQGVQTLLNDSPVYDENHRQKLLLDRARTVPGKRVLLALDADEMLSGNCRDSKDWQKIKEAKPGTLLRFKWVNILPGFREAWIPPGFTVFGFVDDGSEHNGRKIHSPRVPEPEGAPVLDLQEIVVLHFQYILWERMASKQRWYQAWEHAKNKEKGPLRIFRQYNHMFGSWGRDEIHPVKREWLERYDQSGINYKALKPEAVTWWDREIVQMLSEYGAKYFRRIAIWDVNWNEIAAKAGIKTSEFSDPRSGFEKIAHDLLRRSQNNRARLSVRLLEYVLRKAGW